MIRKLRYWTVGFSLMVLVFSGCDEGLNIFTIQDDISLGQQLRDEILNDPVTYPMLSTTAYPDVYAYVNGIRDSILNSGKVRYQNEFEWELYIIEDDILNAFVAPGGYIFVYTGLIKFLDSEDQLAGVMGHEIAHADKRHSTERLTRQYGITLLFDVVLGKNQNVLSDIAQSLWALSFSRANETEADEVAVDYLCGSGYNSAGHAGFFQKILDDSTSSSPPQWLSTHPNPDNRVQNITDEKTTLGCTGSQTYVSRFQSIQASLP